MLPVSLTLAVCSVVVCVLSELVVNKLLKELDGLSEEKEFVFDVKGEEELARSLIVDELILSVVLCPSPPLSSVPTELIVVVSLE